MILKANGQIDAVVIIKANGFADTTPETSLCTRKVFEKDGSNYRFEGWCNYENRQYTAVELTLIAE